MRELRRTAALAVSIFLAVGWLAAAQPVAAAGPTAPPMPAGKHVVDGGGYVSPAGMVRLEEFASRIEAAGGGKVALFTVAKTGSYPSPNDLAAQWNVDGLLLMSLGNYGYTVEGTTLKSKLNAAELDVVGRYSNSDAPNAEAWFLSMLARVDGFLSGTRVWDGAGALDASAKQQAEKKAKDLSDQFGAQIFVDIAYSGDESPETIAFFNGASLASNFDSAVIVALGVSDTKIGGYTDTDNDKIWGNYNKKGPWNDGSIIQDQAFANGDRQAAVLAAIDGIQQAPLLPPEAIFWIAFVIVIVIVSVATPFLFGPWLMRKITGVPAPIKNARLGEAVIESIGETGVTVTMPSVGPEAPEYKFGLQVTPDDGGAPYHADTKAIVPRIFVPMMVPGAHVSVQIDPANPQTVAIDFGRTGAGGAAVAGGNAGKGGMEFAFDANNQPLAGEVSSLVGAVRGGTMQTIQGSADQLLATGTHGTAVITSAQPLGKTVRQVNPHAPADRLDDPIWVFTVNVKLPGQSEFPAVFGHRVPIAKVAQVVPGAKLSVAVDEADKNEEVAIDWDRSPIAG